MQRMEASSSKLERFAALTDAQRERRRGVATLLGRDGHMVDFERRAERAFARHASSTSTARNAARFCRQLLFWESKGRDPSGFIYKSRTEWLEETNLSRYQLKGARELLKGEDVRVLEEARRGWRGGKGNTMWYRLDLERLLEIVGPYAETTSEPLVSEDEAEQIQQMVATNNSAPLPDDFRNRVEFYDFLVDHRESHGWQTYGDIAEAYRCAGKRVPDILAQLVSYESEHH